jgi:predicted nucleic acid-binding protein
MIVVADTSPINYLVLIDAVGVLPELYENIVVPNAVLAELQAAETPEKVRAFVKTAPSWFEVRQTTVLLDAELSELDPGEREAIALAEELKADALIIDERAGREEARKRGIFIIGTLGILNSAAEKDLLDLTDALEKLRQTSFRASEKLISDLLKLNADRKQSNT